MTKTEIEGNKNITISIPISKFIKLKKIANDGNFSVAKLVKDGIDLLLVHAELQTHTEIAKTPRK